MTEYNVLGLMSGTSLDGVDLAFCRFTKSDHWSFELIKADTYPYAQKWQDILANIHELPERLLEDIDSELGIYYSQLIENFINEFQLIPDFISSHGHTALHDPSKGITLQLGNGSVMAHELKLSIINDFRKKDVQMGGQGAPLVPLGDRLLFSEYGLCLNLGGFSNVSFEKEGKRVAFDICPVNMALNEAARVTGVDYDEDGALAKTGEINEALLSRLNSLEYYTREYPKSLGKEWYINVFKEAISGNKISPVDLLATLTEHIAIQIGSVLNQNEGQVVLVTGGGAHNSFLIERLIHHTTKDIRIPSEEITDYKEAIIFGFLGVLRMRNETNVLSSVTGAPNDHCSGVIHKP